MSAFFSFKVRLLDVEPPIWRRFLIRKTATFMDLHEAIQDACRWGNYHLFAFHETENGPVIAGIPDDSYGVPDPDATEVKLSSYFRKGGPTACYYQYDFGDDWWHEVVLEKTVNRQDGFSRQLVDGARAFPPEDCGGTPGYEDCVAVRRGEKPEYQDRDELLEWHEDWSPEEFDLAAAKATFDR
jgi:hypothetical protein